MNAEEILLAAVEKKTPAERAAYLDGACGQDAPLRALVEGLLKAHEDAGSFLEQPLFEPTPTVDQLPNPEKLGAVIGPYKLLQQIGEGGMGTVFMAEQTQPVQRKVALKLIKSGMDSRQVIARFEAERQALAVMDHPNIAKVLDAGTTDSGRPFFVMELVKGVPITRYCDEHHLTPRQRLELFVPVCQAVQHAHQKGIIHRDLKPSNVMVCLYDGQPVPKVIDFGVAKAAGPRLTEKTLFTELGQVVGTLEYMSPEQAELNQLDIDTRSDIYSLGVLLYELLTGTTPLERKRFQDVAFLEVLRLIREEEPPKPSTRLSTTEGLPDIAANRGLQLKKLGGLLRGEIDWIVMKTLEKDRNRRYETPNSLALDIQRYLHDETVLACPPSATYRIRKFARRHKVALTTAGLVAAVLVLGTGVSAWQALRATHAEKHATAQQLAADANFRKARDVVDKMLTRVGEGLANQPRMEKMRRQLLEEALAFYQGFAQERSFDVEVRLRTAEACLRVGDIHAMMRQLAVAEQDYRQAIVLCEQLIKDFPAVPDYRMHLMKSHYNLGNALQRQGRFQEAEPCLRDSLGLAEALAQEFPEATEYRRKLASAQGALGLLLQLAGRPKEAEGPFRQALALFRNLVDAFPQEAEHKSDLALAHTHLGMLLYTDQPREAEENFQKALPLLEELTNKVPDEPAHRQKLAYAHIWLGDLQRELNRLQEAEQSYRRAIPLYANLSDQYPFAAEYAYNLAMAYNNLGLTLSDLRPGEAEKSYRRAIAIWTKWAAELPNDPAQFRKWLSMSRDNLARLFANCPDPKFRNPREAIALAKEGTALAPSEGFWWNTLGKAYYRNGDWKDAIAALEKSLSNHAEEDEGSAWFFLAMAHWQLSNQAEARKCYDRAIGWLEKNKDKLEKDLPQKKELRRIRAEAAELLGMKEKKN